MREPMVSNDQFYVFCCCFFFIFFFSVDKCSALWPSHVQKSSTMNVGSSHWLQVSDAPCRVDAEGLPSNVVHGSWLDPMSTSEVSPKDLKWPLFTKGTMFKLKKALPSMSSILKLEYSVIPFFFFFKLKRKTEKDESKWSMQAITLNTQLPKLQWKILFGLCEHCRPYLSSPLTSNSSTLPRLRTTHQPWCCRPLPQQSCSRAGLQLPMALPCPAIGSVQPRLPQACLKQEVVQVDLSKHLQHNISFSLV